MDAQALLVAESEVADVEKVVVVPCFRFVSHAGVKDRGSLKRAYWRCRFLGFSLHEQRLLESFVQSRLISASQSVVSPHKNNLTHDPFRTRMKSNNIDALLKLVSISQ